METPVLPPANQLWQNTLAWQPNAEQQQQFQRLYEAILSQNRQFNLTRITTVEDFWEKHLWDSLAGLIGLGLAAQVEANRPLRVIDLGTGAGFPGVPVAIALPNWQVTLADSTGKKIRFLDNLLEQLQLSNARTLLGRAEILGQQPSHRQSYDLALLRAVGSASVCAEYAIPLLKTGGLAILYRGHWHEQDHLALERALTRLNSKIEAIHQFKTPLSGSIRHCLYLKKLKPTAKEFPRPVGVPTAKPLENL